MTSADTSSPFLSLDAVCVDFEGMRAVDSVSVDVGPGEIVCLLGPSGCGKSTTLRVAAGVERQTSGRVLMAGRVVSDDRIHLPPEQREIGLMFQDFALFPHLTVAENVAFGLRRRRYQRDRDGIVAGQLARVGLADAAHRYPHQLSGGEQQRVALARALAPKPRIMLMDEPFSGLDARLRDEVREETLSVLREAGAAVMLVTHEPEEAMRMADRIALMRQGRIVQIGAPYNIYNFPLDTAAAAFLSDVNILRSVVRDRQIDTPFGLLLSRGLDDGVPVELVFRPQHLTIAPDTGTMPTSGADAGVPARGFVRRARFVGALSLIEVAMEAGGVLLKATVPYAWLPEPGTPVWLSLHHDRCFVFRDGRPGHALAQAAE